MGQGEGRTHEQGVWLIWQKGNVEDNNPSHQETLTTKNFVGVLLSLTTSLPLIHPHPRSPSLISLRNLPPTEEKSRRATHDPIFSATLGSDFNL